MLLRFFPFVIIAFWIASMAWLCAVVWAPPESRMARIDPRQVYDVFFSWNESTNMTLLENGIRRGQVTIAGGSGDDPDTGKFTNSLSVSGMIESAGEEGGVSSRKIDLFWRGLLDFSEAMNLEMGDFSIRIPNQQLTGHFSLERKPDLSGSDPSTEPSTPERGLESINTDQFVFQARAVLKQKQIFSFDSSKSGAGGLPLHLLPMKSIMGLDKFDPGALDIEAEARMGKFTFGGRDLRAYLLKLRKKGSEENIRIFLSEAGEPLRIESDYGFEAVSEILVPLDAYSDKKS